MGLFNNLFESRTEKERRIKRELRKSSREVENAIEKLSGNLENLKNERDSQWAEAKRLLQSGRKEDAAMALQGYKSAVLNAHKTHKLMMVTRSRFVAMQNASSINEITTALTDMAAVLNVNPDDLMAKLDDIDATMEDIMEIEDIISGTAEKDMAKMDKELAKNTTADDYLMQKLENEALGEITTGNAESGQLNDDAILAEMKTLVPGVK
ncbi:MAG: hypothetical protein E7047_08485 [Lentisphaerae bacterium]|nr:hypothetical protein [Lentisphaerota bacterium]